MSAYDDVAPLYSSVFDDIHLRCFEWPWLEKQILDRKPDSLLDVGCGNGYLLKALQPIVPHLYGCEPCIPMFDIARQQTDDFAELHSDPAENLTFENSHFDMIISLLSFRYMNWDKSLPEMARVLKPEGTLIIIDLFAAAFNPFMAGKYCVAWAKTRKEYSANREYRRKLNELTVNHDWQQMVREFPKRELKDAKQVIEKYFSIIDKKNLCQSFHGKIIGFICKKKI